MERMKDKIAKLLRLSDSPNQHEAQRALAKAQELALKNGLSLEAIEEQKATPVQDPFTPPRNRVPAYERIISTVLAANFRVMVLKHGKGYRETLEVVGLPNDVEIFKQVFAYTLESYRRMLNSWLKDYRFLHPRWKVDQGLKNDYLRGFIAGLDQRFAQNVKEHALVTTVPAVVQDAVEAKCRPSRKLRLSTRSSSAGIMQGFRDANSLNLHSELAGN